MGERLSNHGGYPFSWMDELVEITMNPEKTDVKSIPADRLQYIQALLPAEINRIAAGLKSQAFSLYRGDYIKVVAGQYDQSIRLLEQQMRINMVGYPEEGLLLATGELLLVGLHELSENVRRRYTAYLAAPTDGSHDNDRLLKMTCRLSVDQIGIILKAADDTRLLAARSFSQVLRSIVPFLSTERFENISWKSARSSTYKMEESDKEVAIRALEALIDKIKGF